MEKETWKGRKEAPTPAWQAPTFFPHIGHGEDRRSVGKPSVANAKNPLHVLQNGAYALPRFANSNLNPTSSQTSVSILKRRTDPIPSKHPRKHSEKAM